jgi:hypothetical protein
MRRPPRTTLALAAVLAAAAAVAATGGTVASFTRATDGAARLAAAPDWVAPTASAAVIYKSQTPRSSTGYIKQGGGYRVYANVADTGNPASGASSVTADVGAFSTGVTAAPMTAGSFTVAGQPYTHRSDLLTASTPVAEGPKGYTLALTDGAANGRTATGYTVVVDNTAPGASDVQTANAGTAGRAGNGDRMIYTFSEPIDPDSILDGWTGGATAVYADVLDGGSGLLGLGLGSGHDVFVVKTAAGVTLPLTVDLGTDDHAYTIVLLLRAACDATFHASSMTMSASQVTVTLGGQAGCPQTSGSGTLTWAPAAGPTDRAGNALPTTQRTETGGGDADF